MSLILASNIWDLKRQAYVCPARGSPPQHPPSLNIAFLNTVKGQDGCTPLAVAEEEGEDDIADRLRVAGGR